MRSFVLLSFRVKTIDQDFRSSMAISVVGVWGVRHLFCCKSDRARLRSLVLLSFRVGSVIFNTG